MKLAVFADLHAHNYKEFDEKTDRTGSKRLDTIVDTLLFIRDDCVKRGISKILFAGDMFHVRARVNTVVYNAIYDVLKSFHEHGLELVGIAGNHDQYDNSDVPQHSMHTFNDIEGVTIYGDLGVHMLHNDSTGEVVSVYCVPYSKNAQRIKDWISNLEHSQEYAGNSVCLFHLGISGAFVGSGSYPMADAFNPEDLRPDFFKYLVGGHFHKRQFIGDHPHFFYAGAPIQHSYSDEGEDKGYYIIDTSKRYDVDFVPIPNPKFVTVTGNDLEQYGYDALQLHADAGNYVRALLKEEQVQPFVSHAPVELKYKIVMEKTYEEQTRIPVKIGMTEEEVVTKYAMEHNPDALDKGLKILEEVKGNGRT